MFAPDNRDEDSLDDRPSMEHAGTTVLMLALFGLIPGFFTVRAVTDFQRRSAVLAHGAHALATVVPPGNVGFRQRNLCIVRYAYSARGVAGQGQVIDCSLMRRYPIGSTIAVRFLPSDPSRPLVDGESRLPDIWLAPVLTLPPWLIIAGIFGWDLVRRRSGGRNQPIA